MINCQIHTNAIIGHGSRLFLVLGRFPEAEDFTTWLVRGSNVDQAMMFFAGHILAEEEEEFSPYPAWAFCHSIEEVGRIIEATGEVK